MSRRWTGAFAQRSDYDVSPPGSRRSSFCPAYCAAASWASPGLSPSFTYSLFDERRAQDLDGGPAVARERLRCWPGGASLR